MHVGGKITPTLSVWRPLTPKLSKSTHKTTVFVQRPVRTFHCPGALPQKLSSRVLHRDTMKPLSQRRQLKRWQKKRRSFSQPTHSCSPSCTYTHTPGDVCLKPEHMHWLTPRSAAAGRSLAAPQLALWLASCWPQTPPEFIPPKISACATYK